MTKQLVKRHKRQVARAKQKVKLSEPDVRTPEQIKAAREASAPAGGWKSGAGVNYSGPSSRSQGSQASDTRSKGDS